MKSLADLCPHLLGGSLQIPGTSLTVFVIHGGPLDSLSKRDDSGWRLLVPEKPTMY